MGPRWPSSPSDHPFRKLGCTEPRHGFERQSSGWRLKTKSGGLDADFCLVATGARNTLRNVGTELTPSDAMSALGYYVPEILMEEDLHGPDIDATGAAFPGVSLYVLLGHGQDFAWSATSAGPGWSRKVTGLADPDSSDSGTPVTHLASPGNAQSGIRLGETATVITPWLAFNC